MDLQRRDRAKKVKKNLSRIKELSRTMELGKTGGGSFLMSTPESINAAAQDLQNIGSSIQQSNTGASGTQGLIASCD